MYDGVETPVTMGSFNQMTFSAFALVQPEDYTPDLIDFPKQEKALFIRTVGRVTVDLLVASPGTNSIIWTGALVVMSDEALENTFLTDPTDLLLGPFQPFAPGLFDRNAARLDIIQYFPDREYNAAWQNNAGGSPVDVFSRTNLPDNVFLDWDVNVKRTLTTDESVWLFIAAQVAFTFDPNVATVFPTVSARSLIARS